MSATAKRETGRRPRGSRTAEAPFSPRSVTDRADTAWRKAALERITPHEARHVCASILIASGLNAKAVSVLMGHSSIAITFDTYGHLFEGSETEAAELVGAYLEAQQERAAARVRTAEPNRADRTPLRLRP